MRVTLRKKPVKSGRQQSLYLDIYPPPDGHGRTEFLKLYIFTKPRTAAERAHNRDTLQLAEDIRAVRHREVLARTYGLAHPGAGITIEQHIRAEAGKRKGKTSSGWLYMLGHVQRAGLADVTLDRLNVSLMARMRDYFVTRAGRGEISESSAKTYWQHYRTAIKAALKMGYITEDFAGRTTGIRAQSAVRRALTIEELLAMAQTRIRKERIWVIGMFSALTGLRISDIRALSWGHVYDMPGGPELRFVSIKTRKFEVMPISDQARILIGDRADESGAEKTGYVWPYIPVTSTVNKWLRKWATAAGVDPAGLSIHCMRHTYATLQLASGTDIYTVSKMLGHSSVQTTQIYAKLIDRTKREAANRLILPGIDGIA